MKDVDNTQTTHISLCSGYGGLDLGIKRVIPDVRTIAYVEIDAFPVANLVAKMEAGQMDVAPIWTNLKTFDGEPFRDRVHILSGGYPCQPFSAAGKRKGKEDQRHLWPYIREIVKTVRPVCCFFENVEGHLSLGFREVHASLRRLGYRVEAGIFSASEVGAPHQRKRLFIMAERKDSGCGRGENQNGNNGNGISELEREEQPVFRGEAPGCGGSLRGEELGNPKHDGHATAQDRRSSCEEQKEGGLQKPERGCCQPEELADNHSQREQEQPGQESIKESAAATGNSRIDCWPSRPGEEQYEWEPPRVCGELVNPKSRRSGKRGDKNSEGQGLGIAGTGGEMGNAESIGRQESGQEQGHVPESSSRGQIEQPLGGNTPRTTDRLDYAELCVSCDNRTDELRLLGNGVVPATAAKAFVALSKILAP